MDNLSNKNFLQFYNYITIAFGGIFGVFIRQLYIKKISIIRRIMEYLAGALCAIYGSQLLASILYNLLLQHHLMSKSTQDSENLISLSAFLCGMFGLSICEYSFKYINIYAKSDNLIQFRNFFSNK